jgi:non-homologous end joining protein Ku
MAERGQRITLRFGAVSAAVSLLNTSGKPKAAQHETRRVLVESPTVGRATASAAAGETIATAADPLGEPAEPGLQRAACESGHPVDPDETRVEFERAAAELDPLGETSQPEPSIERMPEAPTPTERPPSQRDRDLFGATAREPREDFAGRVAESEPQTYTPPATDVQQGVHNAVGEWVDLTAMLAEVDERTKVDGMEVVATIPQQSVPRERVRDAKYVASADPETAKVLALLWHGLRHTGRAAVVRYTKRTAQTLGIIVARGSRAHSGGHLLLLEVEWAQNMRPVPTKASGPVGRDVDEREVMAAVDLVEAFAAPTAAMDDLRDERLAKRAELLEAAREGRLADYTPPPEPVPIPDAPDMIAALSASAEAVRDHSTA